jgi:hypothetical protein
LPFAVRDSALLGVRFALAGFRIDFARLRLAARGSAPLAY